MAFKKMKTPVTLGNARFTVYSDGCVRMEYAHWERFSPYASIIVGKKLPKAASAEVEIEGREVRIRTPKFELHYKENGEEFSAQNLNISHVDKDNKKKVWSPGKKDEGNLGTVTRSLDFWKWCGGPEKHPVEGILSTDGGHFLQDHGRVYWNTKYDWPQSMQDQVAFDGYFFAYGQDFKGALKDFITVFGRIPMVPRWTFGFWYSRWYDYTDKEFVALAKRYDKEKIPIDVMIIDTDWRDNWGGYDWSKRTFPNPEKALKNLHDLGLQTSLNDHPGYDAYESLPGNDSHIPAIAKKLGPLPHEGRWACDWSNKKALKVWFDELLGPFFDQGMDFWWIDGWIKRSFRGEDSQLWANWHYFDECEKRTGKRGMILSRWGGVGSHRFPVQFSGDTASEWDTLREQIQFTANSGNLGAIYWSHDIGGFFGKKIDEELFIRWSQFGAMSPVFRTHSDHGSREPWEYSEKAKALFRKQTRIRYALAPYFYTLAREAHDTGMPIIRPLYLEYNDNDGGAFYRKHQYTIGRELLVIPADGAADKKTGMYSKRIYIPNGNWSGLETDETYFGMMDRSIDIPLEIIPTYVRKGAIIPCQAVGKRIGKDVPEEMQFDYYPDDLHPSHFELYEDDGDSKDYEKGRCAVTHVDGSRSGDTIMFKIAAPKGSYKNMPKKRSYVVRMAIDHDEKVGSAEAEVGKGEWQKITSKTTGTCLAGTVKSKRKFCEVSVDSPNQPVQIRVKL
ncbi:MAG: DUF5110 domain-containing protein [Verrucomicrobia bacterium]|nr:DUF5110 domain-containing protein [Verrucomicrobiota bacterium]